VTQCLQVLVKEILKIKSLNSMCTQFIVQISVIADESLRVVVYLRIETSCKTVILFVFQYCRLSWFIPFYFTIFIYLMKDRLLEYISLFN
jgi:hypothetical protein